MKLGAVVLVCIESFKANMPLHLGKCAHMIEATLLAKKMLRMCIIDACDVRIIDTEGVVVCLLLR